MPTAHARRMDAIYRSQRHVYDLTRKYYLLGRDRMIHDLAPPAGGSVLEVGCGTARNLIAAATNWPGTRCFGFDISTEMLSTARLAVSNAGLAGRIQLATGDATTWSGERLFGEAEFDRIFMSYTLSMIPDWCAALDQAARALRPGGRLHIVDFGQQESLPGWWRTALFAWLGAFDVTPRASLFDLATDVATRHRLQVRTESLFRGYAWGSVLSA